MNPPKPQPNTKQVQQLTPEEQKLVAACAQKIQQMSDPNQQLQVIEQMLPKELADKVERLFGVKGINP